MYIFKNAITSILRNKGRNILMLIIITVMSCACAISLSIRNAGNTLVKSYTDKLEITATISMNRQSFMGNFKPDKDNIDSAREEFSKIDSLTLEDITSYADSKYVKSYYYTESISMNSSNIEKLSSEVSEPSDMPKGNKGMSSADFTVIGYSSYDSMTDFIDGKYTITDGEISSDFESNTCVINSELATYNDLSVGDKITLVSSNDTDITYELEITGIYDESSDDNMDMFSSSTNQIITNTSAINEIQKLDEDINININPTFILVDSDSVDKYEDELLDKGMSEYYELSTNLDEASKETESVSNISSFALTFLIITIIIGGIVLFVINMINVRERKYEIGVLRTIGMKKSLVISQFVIELLIVSLIGLTIGASIGSVISVPTANKLLEQEVTSAQEETETIKNNFGGIDNMDNKANPFSNKTQNIDYVTSINAVVDYKVLLELLGIGVILTLVSSLAATISISKFSPLTILKERT